MVENINFVIFNWDRWGEALSAGAVSIDALAPAIRSNEDVWVVLSYLQLTRRGLEATVSDRPLPGKINIVDGISVPSRLASNIYCVGCRSDGHYPGICRVVIHQNLLPGDGHAAIYVPQWGQPGIIPRDPARTGITNLGFLGHAQVNLARTFKEPEFLRELHEVGCELIVRDKDDDRTRWHDYSDLDLVLTFRGIPAEHLRLKPINKLTNAWAAGVPALVGPEPAIEAIRVSPLDYIPVRSGADVLQAVQTFRKGDLYRRMVEHGHSRARAYCDDAVAERWFEALELIRRDYAQWTRASAVSRWLDCRRRSASQKRSVTKHIRTIHRGYVELGYGNQWWLSGKSDTQAS